MPVRAVTFDAYGTLLRNEDLTTIPRRIVADHGLSVTADDVMRRWVELYHEAARLVPFRTLRQMEEQNVSRLLRQLGLATDPGPYVDLFFQVTTKAEPYPEALEVLNALGPVRAAIVSNADHEHVAAWPLKWPVEFILTSEAAQAYKPSPVIFRRALEQLGLEPHEVLHVGDSDIDDVGGARAAGMRVAWLNRNGRRPRPETPAPDHEIRDLRELLALL
jgi:2-haloalkanoic acid dehalogenase type II